MPETKARFRPLADRVLVRPIAVEERTPGGIILPDAAKEKPVRGTVLSVGNGRLVDGLGQVPVDCQEGDTVLYGKYSGVEVDIDGEKLLILQEKELFGVID